MINYTYFTQEGSKFHLKPKVSTAIIRSVICLAIGIALYWLIPTEKKIGLWGALLFVVFALINLLKTTKKLTIDVGNRTIIHKNNMLNGEVTYQFDDFIQFYVLTSKYLFITMDSTAFLIFDQKGKEHRLPVVIGMFSSKPAQNALNELSEIMGVNIN